MITLRHNTATDRAIAILESGRLLSGAAPGIAWRHPNGPYFFVDGWASTEVASGGNHHPTNLYFEFDVPLVGVQRSDFIRFASQTRDREGQILEIDTFKGLVTCCYVGKEFSEARIVPHSDLQLRLVKFDTSDPKRSFFGRPSSLTRLGNNAIDSRQLFRIV